MNTLQPLSDIADRWPAIEALLDEALALLPDERPVWLASLLQRSPELQPTLARLLHRHAQVETDDFLTSLPPLPGPPPFTEAGTAGSCVGPWQLLAPLGRGGMGAVWLAERADGTHKRQVALKLPRLAWDDTLNQRMSRERDILAALEHPHIARLYEASTDDQGRPYLAMEYVEGEAIDAWCTAHAVPIAGRLRLLLQVAQAVSHAHARLVVHRDLKPANILVTADGQARLLDFGIAKLLDGERTHETALTRLHGAAMTPDYASPEQIRGEPLSTASDLYSLGVVAFELLAGVRPYRLMRGTAAELEEAIATIEPPLASDVVTDPAAKQALRGDLDAILNRTLKKRPDDRYASVAEFSQDLQRHLEQQPVLARPDSRRYRLGRFLRRHRVGAAATGAVVLAVCAGTGLALWQARQARAQAARAEAELSSKEAVSDLTIDTLTSVASMASADPSALAQPHAVTRQLEATLQARAARYATRPSEWQALLESVAVQLNYANDFERSLAVGQQYLAHLQAHGGRPQQFIRAHAILGRTLGQLGRLDEAEAVRRAGVDRSPEARDERSVVERLGLMGDLGALLVRRGKRAEAEAVLTRAAALAEAEVPGHAIRGMVLQRLASHFLSFDDGRALVYARQADALFRGLGASQPESRSTVIETLGLALNRTGPLTEAEAAFAAAHALEQPVFGSANRNVASIVSARAMALARQGLHTDAKALLDREIDALTAITTPAAQVAMALLHARRLHNDALMGDVPAVIRLLDRARAPMLTATVARDREAIAVLEAQALLVAGRAVDALALVAPVAASSAGRGLPAVGWFSLAQTLALAQLANGDSAGALVTARALVKLHRAHGAKSWTALVSTEISALAAARAGEVDAALRELAAIDAGVNSPAAVDRAESALRRAEVWQRAGQIERARQAAQAALADLQSQHPNSPRLAAARRLAAGGS